MTRKALNPVTLATIIVIMYMTMPIVSVFISTYITTYAYMLLSVFLIGFITLSGGLRRLNAMIYLLFPFAIYIACTFFTKADSILLWGYQSMLFILPVTIGYYYVNYRPENISLFAKILIVAILLTAITTIIGLVQFPSAARTLATIAESDDSTAVEYWWHNIGGYDFVYICVLLYPSLILAYKLKRVNRLVFYILFALLLALIIASEYTIALLLFIISSILYFAGRKLTAKQLFILGIIIFVLLFSLWDFFKNFLLLLADIINRDSVSDRLRALAGGVQALENFEDNRLELYTISITAFFKSPVFGQIFVTNAYAGGHSFMLDLLANYGIIGGATIAFCYRNIYRYFFKPFSNEQGFGFVLWSFAQAILLSFVNTGMWLNVIAFFVPMISYVIYNVTSEEIYEDSLDSEYAY